MKKVQNGFTFIEVLIVIAIIGIVAALFTKQTNQAATQPNKTVIHAKMTTFDLGDGFQMGRYHDEEKNVTCWISSAGMSCVPDAHISEQELIPTHKESKCTIE